jgi:hypothetical protein
MGIDRTKKPAKMSFTIENLAKSSRDEKSDHTQLDNFSDSVFTPVKLQSDFIPMTSTPLSSMPLAIPNSDRKLKRKRYNSIDSSENSSLNSTDSKSRDCISPNSSSDDSGDSTSESRKKARVAFTSNQVTELEACYSNSKYLPIEERAGLSNRLKLSEQQIKTWFQNRRMKEKRQHKDGNKNYYFPSGGVDVSQLVAMGIPCPPPHNVKGTPSAHLPGYIGHQQYPGSPATRHMHDPRFVSSYMCGYSPMSPVVYPGYSQHIYNGLSSDMR